MSLVESNKALFRLMVEHPSQKEEINRAIAKMSVEDKVAQIFLSFFYGMTFEKEQKSFLDKSGVGNVIYFHWSNDTSSPKRVLQLSSLVQSDIEQRFGIPPLIATDQEGGAISRIQGPGITDFPGNRALAVGSDPEVAEAVGEAMAKELLLGCGVNFNLAPVVDVALDRGFIFQRSFSSDPAKVALYANRLIKGMQKVGVATAVKHFPGYGAAEDTHLALHQVNKTMEALQGDLLPFQKNLGSDAVMSAHLLVPALDPSHPVTLSKSVLTDILRSQMGYEGVVVTDSLMMNGILEKRGFFQEAVDSVKKISVEAFNAGCDLLLLAKFEWLGQSTTPEQDESAIVQIVDHFKSVVGKEVSEKRLNEAVHRIMRMKANLASHRSLVPTYDIQEHHRLAVEVAGRAIQRVSEGKEFFLKDHEFSVIAPTSIKREVEEGLDRASLSTWRHYIVTEEMHTSQSIEEMLMAQINQSEVTLFFSSGLKYDREQEELLHALCEKAPKGKLVIVGMGDPWEVDNKEVSGRKTTYITNGLSSSSVEAFLLQHN